MKSMHKLLEAVGVGNEQFESRKSDVAKYIEDDSKMEKALVEHLAGTEILIQALIDRIALLERQVDATSILVSSDALTDEQFFLHEGVSLDALSAQSGAVGVYAVEVDAQGRKFCWTKKQFSFDIPVNRRGAKTAHIAFTKAYRDEVFKDALSCHVDGYPVAMEKVEADPEDVGAKLTEFVCTLPPSTRKGRTRLVFEFGKAFVPSEVNESEKDCRELAGCFHTLSVK